MIDHHLAPENFDDFRHWDSSAAATAQLVYDLIVNQMDDREHITPDIATCLYTGIMTDTGSFRFSSTSAQVHLIIADLITLGAQNWKIHEHVFNSSTENRLKFLGFCLLNRLEVLPEYNTAVFAVSREDIKQFNVTTGDTEGLVNYALSVSGIRLAALIIDRKERIKISLRSIGDFPCNEICSTYFNGGGHRNAAGGSSDESLEKTVLTFKSILPKYKNLLTQ
jgi:phosphoesterase RecJ-like protein